MKLTLHHINLSTQQVEVMDEFYRDVIGLHTETKGLPVLEKKKGYSGDVAFVTDGHIQMHLAAQDIKAGFKTVNYRRKFRAHFKWLFLNRL